MVSKKTWTQLRYKHTGGMVWSFLFSSVQDSIYAPRKAHMCANPSLKQYQCSSDWQWPSLILSRKIVLCFLFPRLSPPGMTCALPCLWNSSNVRLTDNGLLSSFQGRSSSASYFHTSLFQAWHVNNSSTVKNLMPRLGRLLLAELCFFKSSPWKNHLTVG